MKTWLVIRGDVQELIEAMTAADACEQSKYPDQVTMVLLVTHPRLL